MKPAFTASFPSRRSRYSEKEVQSQGTPSRRLSRGIPSTRDSIFIRYSPAPGARGAMLKPQLPPTTVVTPWNGLGLSVESQKAWAS
jgi:hypothetical protein